MKIRRERERLWNSFTPKSGPPTNYYCFESFYYYYYYYNYNYSSYCLVPNIVMRRPLLLLILLVLAILAGAVYLVSTFIGLLFESGLQNAIIPETLSSRLN